MAWIRYGCALWCLMVATGCGARSTLDLLPSGGGGSSSAGTGGGTTTTTTTTTTTGGGGPCASLSPRAEVRSFDTHPERLGHRPQLVATSADGARVTLVIRADLDPMIMDAVSLLTQVTLDPWSSWSAAPLGDELLIGAGIEYVTPRTREDGLTVWFYFFTQGTGPGMGLLKSAPTDVPEPPGEVLMGLEARPSFVTGPVGSAVGLGTVTFFGGAEHANLAVATPQGMEDHLDYACTQTPMWMAGIRGPGGFLAALTTPQTLGCDVGRAVEIVRYSESEPPATTHAFDLSTSLVQLHMVPRSDGAWVVWQTGDSETSGPLEALRIDQAGQPLSSAIELVGEGTVFETVGLATLGDDLAVAYSDAFDPSTPTIVVEVFADDGFPKAGAMVTPLAWPRPNEPYALLGSPSEDALLLAWSAAEPDPGVAGTAQVYAVRLDCGP